MDFLIQLYISFKIISVFVLMYLQMILCIPYLIYIKILLLPDPSNPIEKDPLNGTSKALESFFVFSSFIRIAELVKKYYFQTAVTFFSTLDILDSAVYILVCYYVFSVTFSINPRIRGFTTMAWAMQLPPVYQLALSPLYFQD